MNRYLDTGLVVVTNFIGYWSVAICFFTLLKLGIVSEGYFVDNNAISFRDWSSGILIVWLVCMVFSVAGLFIRKNERYVLLLAPAVVPAIYGFSVLFLIGGVSL